MAIATGAPSTPDDELAYQRGMRVTIYRNPHGDFSNGGASALVAELTVTRVQDMRLLDIPHGLTRPLPRECRVFAPDETAWNAALVVRQMGDRVLLHVAPLTSLARGVPMMGGCYVATSDSRWTALLEAELGHGFYGALALHDRTEG